MQVWIRPTTRYRRASGSRERHVPIRHLCLRHGYLGTHVRFGRRATPELGDDFTTDVPVAYNAWTHIMQRTFENDGVVLYINGVAVDRFQADYEVATIAITPTPNRSIYVGSRQRRRTPISLRVN